MTLVTPVTRLGRTCDSENAHRYWICHTCHTCHGRFRWQARVAHLAALTCQRLFELASERPWSIDVPRVAGHEQWCEKGEPLDMIPVRVGDHEVSVAARSGGQQRLA
jgi:hypothetical protein